jgi:hypothetical protein
MRLTLEASSVVIQAGVWHHGILRPSTYTAAQYPAGLEGMLVEVAPCMYISRTAKIQGRNTSVQDLMHESPNDVLPPPAGTSAP